ncbi:hypothetical protein SERLA73DRAFT_77035 [Serpula lacrymans var. lacrymans S7.3]|uniref:Uncharacterized protein n=2 Tax=Serpula lacrymans var. lacrymans TaxID=341189 RepID=F8Q8W3_SERL3|nr:uncharacterized protein SERLADRAFT_441856 [Serpula lacrymans var. lacrymans S7.9]EGN95018.1 hypothetical protein SERLA73DRAFT_77035 [Serpula lacrymans var. lacrymans S7.3]EGO20514.1 hypothetical protein SERLADRAFT_441856 [Serpula lacrymans var. lacrymans S7.9]
MLLHQREPHAGLQQFTRWTALFRLPAAFNIIPSTHATEAAYHAEPPCPLPTYPIRSPLKRSTFPICQYHTSPFSEAQGGLPQAISPSAPRGDIHTSSCPFLSHAPSIIEITRTLIPIPGHLR